MSTASQQHGKPCRPRYSSRHSWMLLGSLVLMAGPAGAWLSPTHDAIEAGNRLVKNGKYEEAINKYGEVLVDQPDSPLLNYNMGIANFKAGKYSEALSSFSRVRTSEDDPQRLARVAYNAGNAQYRLAAAAEAQQPQEALKAYAAALAAYRRALGVDPSDRDAKFNFEFVSKKLDDLKRRLEEQRQQQEQPPEEQNQQEQPQDQDQEQQPNPEEQPSQEQQQDQGEPAPPEDPSQDSPEQSEPQSQPEAGEDQAPQDDAQEDDASGGGEEPQPPSDQPAPSQAAGGEAAAPAEKKEQMSASEAASLIDAVRNEELRPEDFARRRKAAGVADAAENW